MLPYYHPTTILVVDDDPYYVESFKFHFGDQFPCVSYTHPERAIEHLTAGDSRRHAGSIAAVIGDPNRFRRISVLVIDYDMPAMTGVQVCRAIRHLPVRKLLLTGKAGVDTAIAAFNEGVIDTFLTKHDPDLEQILPRQIKRLQDEFFKATTQSLVDALKREDIPFMRDASVMDAINGIIRSRTAIEHYLMTTPTGVLTADRDGQAMMLVVLDEESLRAHWEVARDNGAPNELLEVLATRRVIPLFPTASGYFEREIVGGWSRHLYPAQRAGGEKVWHMTVVRADQVPHIFPSQMTTYSVFEALQGADERST